MTLKGSDTKEINIIHPAKLLWSMRGIGIGYNAAMKGPKLQYNKLRLPAEFCLVGMISWSE